MRVADSCTRLAENKPQPSRWLTLVGRRGASRIIEPLPPALSEWSPEVRAFFLATVKIAKWVYQQTEKANGQVWVMEKVLRHLSAEWSQCFAA